MKTRYGPRCLLCLSLFALLIQISTATCSAREPRRRGGPPSRGFDPELMEMPPWMAPYISPWGPGVAIDYGFWNPIGGSWDALLETGPTTSIGAQWKYADWTGDLLPPSSTFFKVDYRYAFNKGDTGLQLFTPDGFVGEIDQMRTHLFEVGAHQRFATMMRGHAFIDVGTVLGIGGANGDVEAALPDATRNPYFLDRVDPDGVILRGGLNTGIGLQFSRLDLRFTMELGLSGSNALSNGFRSQGDFGMRLGGTIYLDP